MGGKSHGFCGVLCFLGAHTDLTDLTDFFCGWKISRIVWGGVFLWLTQMPQISLIFFVGGKSHGLWGALLFAVKHAKGMSLRYDAPVA